MDHKAFNEQTIDTVTIKKSLFTKTDVKILRRGLKRTGIALLTTFLFALSIFSFIAAATATGYWAVVLFFSAIVLMIWALAFLYAQGITDEESRGDYK